MKRSPFLWLMPALLWGSLCFGQAKVPASLVSVSTNDFQNFALMESLYGTSAPTGRVQYTAQHLFDWLDDNWADASITSSNWYFLSPTAETAQAVFDFIDANSMPGTNIAGFAFNPTNKSWTPPAAVAYADHYASVVDTNLTGASNWYVRVWTNWDAATNGVNGNWSTSAVTNVTAVFYHPAYVTADGIMFPSFVTKEEFYAILNELDFANVAWFTYLAGSYGGSNAVPSNENMQYWDVPASDLVTTGQVISVHCWGANKGGYAYGELVVVPANEFDSTNPSHVTNGMRLCVQVGPAAHASYAYTNLVGGRAAIWRYGDSAATNFTSFTNELLVAGGGDMFSVPDGGGGGGTNGLSSRLGSEYASGGTQSAGGVSSLGGEANGCRVWGGYAAFVGMDGQGKANRGGDGYYGGAAYGVSSYAFGGGGGSGYFAPGITNGALHPFNQAGAQPPATTNVAWGLNAGYEYSDARVAIVIKYQPTGE